MTHRCCTARCLLIAAFLVLPSMAGATNSRAELEQVLRDILDWLPGEYDSSPQIEMERRYGAPPDGEHDDWYRIFALIDAPQIGEHVIYGQLHIGNRAGPLVKGTQIVYNVRIDEETGTVHANGRRIANPERFLDAHERPELWSQIEIDPMYGGNCDFRWTRHGDQVHGILGHDGTCTMTSKVSGKEMMFDAEWVLNAEELWLFDNNYIVGQGMFMGREDRTHIRLYKIRPFACTVEPPGGGAPATIRLHDRGGEARVELLGTPYVVSLMRTDRLLGAQPVFGEVTALTMRAADQEQPAAEAAVAGRADALSLLAPFARVDCSATVVAPSN